MQDKTISGFSKWSKEEKVKWLAENFFADAESYAEELSSFWHGNVDLQRILDGFSENTISNYIIPYGIAPNFLINDQVYAIPMVIEESSVVAAAASAAKFWLHRGGFKANVISTKKLGQVHFTWAGAPEKLKKHFAELEVMLRRESAYLTANMESRGGGVIDIELRDMTSLEPNYFQLMVSFETCDSMGANFINSVLEEFAQTLENFLLEHEAFTGTEQEVNIIMAILSNYTPECLVRVEVSCPVEHLKGACQDMDGPTFAQKFATAIRIAQIDPYRATTHNKGIFNGVDAVVLATANDFRAIEACGHTYAARDGQYRSLSSCEVKDGTFRFWMDLPLALGTVGGLTTLHPLAKRSLELLGNPGAEELMMIIAATGLAQNFAAVRSLVTTGIQHGHMKMHLKNILNHLGADEREALQAEVYFTDKVVSFSSVREFVDSLRNRNGQAIYATKQRLMSARAPYHLHTHGKLLLSAEYFVLDGALALALPTRLGQSLRVEPMHDATNQIHWKSFTVEEQCWFEGTFSIFPLEIVRASDHQTAQRVLDLLQSISALNPGFFKKGDAFQIQTHLDFFREWGLGSSSTLVSAVAQWAEVDPYQLLADTFGGSGYDLACAEAKGPILYQKRSQQGSYVEIPFRPTFTDQLYFVYLGQKQDSREGIQRYRNVAGKDTGLIQQISQLSLAIANATSLSDFEKLILHHEQLVSQSLQLKRAKELHFPGFPGEIKSLGAWGGDFVLAASPLSQAEMIHYFQQKGFKTIFAYHDLIL